MSPEEQKELLNNRNTGVCALHKLPINAE